MTKLKDANSLLPSNENVLQFEMLYPLLEGDISEIRELSKKKQDEPLNKLKVKILNKKLLQVKEILRNEPTFQYLELLDEDTFPSNSDAVLMMTQFQTSMNQYKAKYYTKDDMWKSSWKTKD